MAVYSIKDLEKLSGIKAHTIRMWEQRYAILKPQRTKTNIRYYQEEDLKYLLNIALLKKNGFKISKISKMSVDEIRDEVAQISSKYSEVHNHLDALTLAMMEMDEYKFSKIVEINIRQMGFEDMLLKVIFPFLEKLDLLWLTGTIQPVQERFVSCLIRQKIMTAIDEIPLMFSTSLPSFMVFLPEGEQQELSILLMQYLLKKRGFPVCYLGLNIGIEYLKDAFKIQQPNYVYTMVTEAYTKQSIGGYVEQLKSVFYESQLLLSGYQVMVNQIDNDEQIVVLRGIKETILFLNELSSN